MMDRRFLNMVVHEYGTRVYSLCRINLLQHLFHPSTAAAQEAAAAAKSKKTKKKEKQGWLSTIPSCKRLPRPEINFQAPPSMANACTMHFFSLLREQGESCIMFADPFGHTTIYDADMESVVATPDANFCKPSDSISLSMTTQRRDGRLYHEDEHGLYVINSMDGSFEVFNYCRTGVSAFPSVGAEWYWRTLPCPPPCLGHWTTGGAHMILSAAAVVDDSTICASSMDGIYIFDTVRRVWRQAGSWVLPFRGTAEYVPELSLWFGLEAAGGRHLPLEIGRLCAFDLSSAMADSQRPPAVQHAWDYLDHLPDEWSPSQRHLVNLGSGRFCIATFCSKAMKQYTCTSRYSSEEEDMNMADDELTVLTGVEVVRCDDGLQMIKHKSKRYSFENIRIQCVL